MAQQDKRKAPYQAKSEVDSFAGLTEKLAKDLRTHIRGLSAFSVLSDPWCRMANGLERIGNVTEMERQLPKEDKDATIWECEEQALRFIMEDGKLNLCLRLMVDFKDYERERPQMGAGAGAGAGAGTGASASTSTDGESKDGDAAAGRRPVDQFELGLGLLLRNAWLHIEALQTTDLPLLLTHIANVMRGAAEGGALHERIHAAAASGDLRGRQEEMVLHYLLALIRALDDIGEDRIMPIVLEQQLLRLAADHLLSLHGQLDEAALSAGAEALALICDSEDFGMNEEECVPDDATRRSLVALKDGDGGFLGRLSADAERRRLLRPLLDVIDQARRELPGK